MKFDIRRIPRRRRLMIWVALIFLSVPCLLWCILPPVFSLIVIFPDNADPGDPPEGFANVTLTTSDAVELGAWYAPPSNGAAIILFHGAGSGRESLLVYAEMLHSNGFGVLVVSARGFNESEGQINRLGWNGTLDVGAAVAYLENQPDVQAIGGLGVSMGGNMLLGATAEYPQIRGVIADGASSRTSKEYRVRPAHRKIWRYFSIQMIDWSVQLFTDDEPPLPLLDAMIEAENTHFLFVAAGRNQEEVDFNEEFAAAVPERGILWIAEGVGHTGAIGLHREEYERRAVTFFEENLLTPESKPFGG